MKRCLFFTACTSFFAFSDINVTCSWKGTQFLPWEEEGKMTFSYNMTGGGISRLSLFDCTEKNIVHSSFYSFPDYQGISASLVCGDNGEFDAYSFGYGVAEKELTLSAGKKGVPARANVIVLKCVEN
jgi:hypothetical protein